ncbi:hypothetical protein [Streptomyces sp. NPDC001020]
MKSLLHAAGIAVTAAILCLTTVTSASAATGTLYLNGKAIKNPSGCYNSRLRPLGIQNHTNEAVLVFRGSDCTGTAEGVVAPRRSHVFEFGASVYVP